jgi:hypothetical protein
MKNLARVHKISVYAWLQPIVDEGEFLVQAKGPRTVSLTLVEIFGFGSLNMKWPYVRTVHSRHQQFQFLCLTPNPYIPPIWKHGARIAVGGLLFLSKNGRKAIESW